MKATFRYLMHVILLVVLLQGALIAAVYYATRSRTVVDTYDAFGSIYTRSLRMAVYGTSIIARQSARPQLVVLGISDALLALRPEQLSALTHLRVHSLATEQQNITSFSRLTNLVYQQMPPENWPNLNVIVAVGATAFKNDATRWKAGLTDVEQEMLRYGAFQQTDAGISPRFGKRNISMMMNATLPFMLPLAAYSKIVSTIPSGYETFRILLPESWSYGLFKPWFPDDAQTNTSPALTGAARELPFNHYNQYLGPPQQWDETGLQQLEQLAGRVSDAGGHFFYVDMPSATWLHNGMPFYAYYQHHKAPYIARMQAMPRVHYINLQQGFSDDAFYDGAHSRAAIRPQIARRVAEPVNRALNIH